MWVLFFLCLNTPPCFSQKEAKIRYFGKNAGLDFSTSSLSPLTNGQINSREDVSSVSDKTIGQLLFYTEGTTVWNRNNAIMPNDTINKLITITNCSQTAVSPSFTAPDTICINNPVNITNTSIGASSYYWNFCVGNLNNTPIGTNMGNINGAMQGPVYMDYVFDNGNYYGFVSDNYSGNLLRLDFGNSLLNNPTLTNLGTLGGVLKVTNEGIQVIKNEGKWYAIIVGGEPAYGIQPFIAKVEFGPNIANPNPVATNWGNLGNMQYPHDLYVFNDASNHWYGLTVNTNNNTITRFDFTTSFSNTPTAVNLGNIGNLNGPTGIHAIIDNSNWYAFVTNANSSTITRLNFGNSLLNVPTGQNIGNPGNIFNTKPWDIQVLKFCGQILAFVIDASTGSLVKLDFNNNITNNTPAAVSFGNIGSMSFPHCLSRIFRAGADLYAFVPNVSNATLTRIQFAGCTNASIPNSTAQTPPPIQYSTPGTYNINLTIDDGLSTQDIYCKQVVVLPAPVQSPTQQKVLCNGSTMRIGTSTKNATYIWNTGAVDDSIDIGNPGTYWVQINRFGCSVTDTIIVKGSSCIVKPGFTAPDTTCINNPVNIINTSIGTSSYYWNFCVGNLNNTPIGANLGNIGGVMQGPVYMDYVFDNGNYYGFVTDNYSGNLLRLDFGNSLLNTPALANLGTLGGVLRVSNEGIQVIKNEGKWYAIIVGGEPAIGIQPYIVKVEFGASITNPAPVATNWGNLGNMQYPHDLYVFNDDNNHWYGLTVNTNNNTITRFDFTNSFSNIPTAVNLGNIGNLNGPTGIHAILDNGNWYAFVTNASSSTITRLDFGNSLLNTPTGQNIGNLGGSLHTAWDIYLIKFCGELLGYVLNADGNYNELIKLDFNNNITNNTPSAVNFSNIGNMNFPHCLSRIFRAGADLYTFVPNVSNATITRIQFAGCTNANIPNSTAQTPPPIQYNTPGTYNINLTVDDGLPTQDIYCKQVVVLPAPVQSPTQQKVLCNGSTMRIGTGTQNAAYLWNTGATSDSIDINTAGVYWVEINRFGCKVTDTIKIAQDMVSDFSFKQDVCNPYQVQFFGTGTVSSTPYWDLGDGNTATGSINISHTYTAFGDYTIKFSIHQGACVDTVTKVIRINIVKDDIVITPDTVICDGTTKLLRTRPALSFCWSPTTYLSDPLSPNPVTNTPQNITYYFTAEVPGNNLIVNGDFSAGNTGFTSGYQQAANNTTEGQYTVGANPQTWNPNLNACTDHTSGKGNMLLINGSPVPDVKVWSQTVPVTPNTNYAFSTWIQALYPPNPALLSFSINGKDLGNPITASLPVCTSSQFYTVWNSGNNTTATISIVNKNTQVQGNDFALDDISFAPVLIKRDSVVIIVENPIVKAGNDTTVCTKAPVPLKATGAVQYAWSPQTGLSNPAIANPIAQPAADIQYIVTGTTANGCVAKDTIQVNTFTKPLITKINDTTVCRNSSLPLFASGGQFYQWTPTTGLSDPTIPNPIAYLGASDVTYAVKITDIHSCDYIESVKLAIRPYPAFSASGNKAICYGSSTTLSAAGGDSYQWTPANLLSDPNISTPSTNPEVTTQYSVYIQEKTCHYDTSISMTIKVNPVPVITVKKANDINCNTPSAQLTASGALQYTWNPATGLDDPYRYNPVSTADSSIVYRVQGTNEFGCSTDMEVPVDVSKDGIPRFVVPNAFTPNGDGNNDCFGIKRWGNAIIEDFSIYNRWGQLVFRTNNPAQCWDGTINGKPQDSGGFVYIIKARTLCGPVLRKGIVMLIR